MISSVASLAIATAVLFAIGLWWFGTGAILWLDRQPRSTYGWSLACGVAVAIAALAALIDSRDHASVLSALTAFAGALALWGGHELAFLTGLVTGPRRTSCPPDVRGFQRFVLAAQTLIYHELALALTAVLLVILDWGRVNAVGAWAFLILLVGRLSAKLNLFWGIPHFTAALFPEHLRYIATYVRTSPPSPFLAISVAAGASFAGAEACRALIPGASPFTATAAALLFSLSALATLEHLFMLIPSADAALWRWAAPVTGRSAVTVPAASDAPLQGGAPLPRG